MVSGCLLGIPVFSGERERRFPRIPMGAGAWRAHYHGAMHTRNILSITTVLGAVFSSFAPQARSQVILNEIFENPPGGGVGEVGWEFLELYGCPGMSLDGCAVLLLKGGLRVITEPLAAVGRMAFTNYITQSLIMTTIFWGGR